MPLDDVGEFLCYFRDRWVHIHMEEIEEGLKEEVIFRPSSCKWAVLDKRNLSKGNSRRALQEPNPGKAEHSGNTGKSLMYWADWWAE